MEGERRLVHNINCRRYRSKERSYNALFEDGNVLSDEGLSDPLLTIIEEEIRKEEIEKLHSILAAFTEKQRFVLFQCVVNGRMQIDVANEMGTTRMNVTISLRKSLDRLREYFDVSDRKFGTNHFYRPEE